MSNWTNGHLPGEPDARHGRRTLKQRGWRSQLRRWATALCLAIMLIGGSDGLLPAGLGIVFAAPPPSPRPPAVQGTPYRADPHARASSTTRPAPQAPAPSGAATSALPPVHNARLRPMSMAPGSLTLKPGAAATFTGSDGMLEVSVPANAVTATDVAAAGGGLSLRITQIAPSSGSNAGGSGLISFGTYLVQVVDAHGVLARQGLRAPATVRFHPAVAKGRSALDLSQAFVVLNGSRHAGNPRSAGDGRARSCARDHRSHGHRPRRDDERPADLRRCDQHPHHAAHAGQP